MFSSIATFVLLGLCLNSEHQHSKEKDCLREDYLLSRAITLSLKINLILHRSASVKPYSIFRREDEKVAIARVRTRTKNIQITLTNTKIKMKKYQPRTQFTFKKTKASSEINRGKSTTVQGDAYTVQELLDKHTHGMYPVQDRQGTFTENTTFDDIDETKDPAFDIVDAGEMKYTLDKKLKTHEKQKLENSKTKEEENKRLIKAGKEALEKKSREDDRPNDEAREESKESSRKNKNKDS